MTSSSNAVKIKLTSVQQKALKDYREYKKIRSMIVNPTAFNDIEAILKGLQGTKFLQLQEDVEQIKKSRGKKHN